MSQDIQSGETYRYKTLMALENTARGVPETEDEASEPAQRSERKLLLKLFVGSAIITIIGLSVFMH